MTASEQGFFPSDESGAADLRRRQRADFGLLALVLFLVVGLIVGAAGWWGYQVARRAAFNAELTAIHQIIDPWEQQPPAHIDPHVWREVFLVVQVAVGNVCYTPDAVSRREMHRLRADLEAKAAEGRVTVDTLDWLWRRLSQTGPHGAKYITQMQPLWDEAKPWAQPPAEPP